MMESKTVFSWLRSFLGSKCELSGVSRLLPAISRPLMFAVLGARYGDVHGCRGDKENSYLEVSVEVSPKKIKMSEEKPWLLSLYGCFQK